MPAEYAAKAAAMLIAINAIAAPLPDVIEETNAVTFVEVLADPNQANGGWKGMGVSLMWAAGVSEGI